MSSSSQHPLLHLHQIDDPRKRLVETRILLSSITAVGISARRLRDTTIAVLAHSGTGEHELAAMSGMSKAHVANCRRKYDADGKEVQR
jgi:hypothetical protein